jgi:hypothetical protein
MVSAPAAPSGDGLCGNALGVRPVMSFLWVRSKNRCPIAASDHPIIGVNSLSTEDYPFDPFQRKE